MSAKLTFKAVPRASFSIPWPLHKREYVQLISWCSDLVSGIFSTSMKQGNPWSASLYKSSIGTPVTAPLLAFPLGHSVKQPPWTLPNQDTWALSACHLAPATTSLAAREGRRPTSIYTKHVYAASALIVEAVAWLFVSVVITDQGPDAKLSFRVLATKVVLAKSRPYVCTKRSPMMEQLDCPGDESMAGKGLSESCGPGRRHPVNRDGLSLSSMPV